MRWPIYTILLLLSLLAFSSNAESDDAPLIHSYHYGLFSSKGTDIIGMETRAQITGRLYSFYGFGFPSFLTGGLSYYSSINADGLVITAGFALGAPAYKSISWQWRLEGKNFFEAGVGYATFFEGEGYYPVIAYETRY